MGRQRDHVQLARETVVSRLVDGLHAGMLEVGGAVHARALGLAVAGERPFHAQDRQRIASVGRREGDRVGPPDELQLLVGQRQGDRDRPRQPVGQVHRLEHGAVVGLALEAGQRRERPDGDHLQVRQLTLVHGELREVRRLLAQAVRLLRLREAVHQGPAVRCDRVVLGHRGLAFSGRRARSRSGSGCLPERRRQHSGRQRGSRRRDILRPPPTARRSGPPGGRA